MPRFYFYFNASDDHPVADDDGVEFPNAHAARDAAIKTLPDVARDEIGKGQSREIMVLMRNEAGQAVFTAALTLTAKWLVDTA